MPDETNTTPENPPKPLTEADVLRLLTARFTEFAKKQEKVIADLTQTISSSVQEGLGTLRAALPAAPATDPKKTPETVNVADHPEFKGMQRRLAELEGQATRATEDAARERARSRDTSLRHKLQESLIQGGIDPARTRHAIALLVDGEKRVRYGDDDNEESLVFRDADDQDVDFATGVKSWLRGEDAKLYMPARGTGGSGDNGGSNPRGRGPTGPNPQPGALGRYIVNLAAGVTDTSLPPSRFPSQG